MTAIGNSFFTRRPSAWSEIQAWRENQRTLNSNFTSYAASVADALNTVATSNISGSASLAAQVALTRIKKSAAAKSAAAVDANAKANIAWTPPPTTSVSLADGTTIDLASGRMTMGDGTAIDTITGLPKVNFTV